MKKILLQLLKQIKLDIGWNNGRILSDSSVNLIIQYINVTKNSVQV